MGSDMSGIKDMDMGSISEMSHDVAPQSGGPNVIFHSGFPKAGLYKMREQFRHEGKIITAPFVLNVGQGAMKTATPSSTRWGEKTAKMWFTLARCTPKCNRQHLAIVPGAAWHCFQKPDNLFGNWTPIFAVIN